MTSKERLHLQTPPPSASSGQRWADNDRTVITTGTIGALLAAICCATPLLSVLLGVIGLSAWAKRADYVLILVIFVCLLLVGLGLFRRRYRRVGGPSS
jgi:mercuric ion transport protein